MANKTITQYTAAVAPQDTDELLLQRGAAYLKITRATLLTGVVGGGGNTNLTVSQDATSVSVLSDTGTDAALPAATGSLAGVMTAADKTKLDGIEAGATADQTGAEIVTAIDTQLGSTAWQAGAAGSATNLTMTRDGTSVNILSDTGTDASIPLATASLAGVFGASDKAKLDGLPSSAVATSSIGIANGVAGLDGAGKVPSAQLPSYVDDVLEFANLASFPGTGETGKIYVAIDTGLQWRWTGSAYAQIFASPGSTDNVPEGSVNLYHTQGRVLSTPMTGLSTASSADITATDTVLQVAGKFQAKWNAFAASVRAVVLTGLSTADATDVAATDSVLVGFGKFQAKWNAIAATVRGTVLTGLSTASATAISAADTVLVALGKLQAQVSTKPWTEQVVTGTALTLAATDHYKTFIFSNAGAIGITVPAAASGIRCQFVWPAATGTITLTPSGTTVNGAGTAIVLAAAAGSAELVPTGTANDWQLSGAIGDLVAADVTDSTAAGRAVLTAADAAAQRTAIGAQPTLVSATNIKTVNGASLLGSGDLAVSGGGSSFGSSFTLAAFAIGFRGTLETLPPSLGWSPSGTNSAGAGGLTDTFNFPRITYTSAATIDTAVGVRGDNNGHMWFPGTDANSGQFAAEGLYAPNDATAGRKWFSGLREIFTWTTGEPSAFLNCVGFGADSGDAQLSFMHNNGAGAATKVALNAGTGFPAKVAATDHYYWRIVVRSTGSARAVDYYIKNLDTGLVASGTVTTDAELPVAGTNLIMACESNTGATATASAMLLSYVKGNITQPSVG